MTTLQQEPTEEKTTKIVREGAHIVEVDVTLVYTGHEWSPYLAAADVRRLDQARLALRAGDLVEAAKYGRVYVLHSVAAE